MKYSISQFSQQRVLWCAISYNEMYPNTQAVKVQSWDYHHRIVLTVFPALTRRAGSDRDPIERDWMRNNWIMRGQIFTAEKMNQGETSQLLTDEQNCLELFMCASAAFDRGNLIQSLQSLSTNEKTEPERLCILRCLFNLWLVSWRPNSIKWKVTSFSDSFTECSGINTLPTACPIETNTLLI